MPVSDVASTGGSHRRVGLRVSLVCAVLLAAVACVPSSANALIGLDSFSVEPSTLQAGGHPDLNIKVDFCGSAPICSPLANEQLRNLALHLPPGLLGNPLAPARCSRSTFDADPDDCPADSKIGTVGGEIEAPLPLTLPVAGSLYNVEPGPDEIGRLGIDVAGDLSIPGVEAHPRIIDSAGQQVSGDLSLDQESLDFPETIPAVVLGVPVDVPIKVRNIEFNLDGEVGSPAKPYIVNPTSCELATTKLEVNSWADSTYVERTSSYTPDGCDSPPMPAFEPSIEVEPDTSKAGAPSGYTLAVEVDPHADQDPITSHIEDTRIEFPQGLGISPSAAGDLDACSDAQLASESCPADAKIGDIKVWSPYVDGDRNDLALDPIAGVAYAGEPTDDQPFRLLMDLDGPGLGVQLRSTANVDETTGRITSIVLDQPQVPFERFELKLKGGDYAVLANPNRCGSYEVAATFTPRNGQSPVSATDSFEIDGDGAGGDCPDPKPFKPTLDVTPTTSEARATPHLKTVFTRAEGEQQLVALNFQSAPGIVAYIGSVPQCAPDLAYAGNCPEASRIGDIEADVGPGDSPLHQSGSMYLTQPLREGDVIGFAFVIPAIAGPFDFGKFVNTSGVSLSAGGDTATTETASIPTVFKGVPVQIRRIEVDVNRDNFLLNPSGCDAREFKGEFTGSLDFFPVEPLAKSSTAVPFQPTGCDKLPFDPKLQFIAGEKGQTDARDNPPVKAIYTQGPGQAALRSSRVAIPGVLRPNLRSVQRLLCQAATPRTCPASSRVGIATIDSPLLSEPLTGNLFLLQEPGKILPRLAISTQGAVSVDIQSRNVIEGIKTVNYFDVVPDVPLAKTEFSFFGGPNGLLSSFDDLCVDRSFGEASFASHNGKSVSYKPLLAVEGCPVVARMLLLRRTIKIDRRGVGRLRMRCRSSRKCAGELTLQTGSGGASRVTTIARGRVSIKPRKRGTVKIRLAPKRLELLRKRKRLRTRMRLALNSQPVLSSGSVTLVPKRRHP
ncbi:MAG: hypothetical protein WDZ37_01005 [Solirubrobacterales bacterium]